MGKIPCKPHAENRVSRRARRAIRHLDGFFTSNFDLTDFAFFSSSSVTFTVERIPTGSRSNQPPVCDTVMSAWTEYKCCAAIDNA